MSGRVQLALNVNDLDQSVAFYSSCSAPSPPSGGPVTPTSPSPSRRSSSSCWRTPARAAASTTSASRSATPAPSTPSRPGSPRPGSPPPTSATRPAATPGRTSSGSRAHPTASPGRSTPSWPTARPSTTTTTAAPVLRRRRQLREPSASARPAARRRSAPRLLPSLRPPGNRAQAQAGHREHAPARPDDRPCRLGCQRARLRRQPEERS